MEHPRENGTKKTSEGYWNRWRWWKAHLAEMSAKTIRLFGVVDVQEVRSKAETDIVRLGDQMNEEKGRAR